MEMEREGLGGGALVLVFLLAVGLLVSRLPQMFLHAQFYAEDGWVWYQQAYNLGGLRALLMPQAGYMQTLPRLVTWGVLTLPLAYAPLAMNGAGVLIDALPVCALLSRRCRTWGPLPVRLGMAVMYLAIPNAQEIHVVLTNAMWHFAVLQMLLAFAAAPVSRVGKAMDVLVFGVGVLSGPFCLLMLPAVGLYWWRRRERWTLVVGGIMAVGAVVQLLCIHAATRAPGMPLGVSVVGLLRLLGGSVLLDSMVGVDFIHGGPYLPVAVLVLVTVGGLLVLMWGLRRAPLPLLCYGIFAVLTYAASLKDPLITGPLPRWALLATQQNCRYWYYPSLLFVWAGLWCAFERRQWFVRAAGVGVVALFCFGAVRCWEYKPWPAMDLSGQMARWNAARPGERVVFPVYPDTRSMELVKR